MTLGDACQWLRKHTNIRITLHDTLGYVVHEGPTQIRAKNLDYHGVVRFVEELRQNMEQHSETPTDR